MHFQLARNKYIPQTYLIVDSPWTSKKHMF
jgi:hypothetical protein